MTAAPGVVYPSRLVYTGPLPTNSPQITGLSPRLPLVLALAPSLQITTS
jgi:hypothetical protein